MNGTGTYVPPLNLLSRKNKEELLDGELAGSILACYPSGWIQTGIFTDWFDHFRFVKPSADNPVLLVVDVKKYESDEMYQLDATIVVYYHKYLYMFTASICLSSGVQVVCYCVWCSALKES
jgi:hypothetical protein